MAITTTGEATTTHYLGEYRNGPRSYGILASITTRQTVAGPVLSFTYGETLPGVRRVGPNGSGGAGLADAIGRILADGTPAAVWGPATLSQLAAIADRWHLNDTRAGCEHQRAAGWQTRPIDPAKRLDAYGYHYPGQTSPSWNMLTWVRPSEYPDGLLAAPCPECGYRFGSAWLFEEVPANVLAYLSELPF